VIWSRGKTLLKNIFPPRRLADFLLFSPTALRYSSKNNQANAEKRSVCSQ
jgi:hypothetical protein